ncbi:MAG TPA: oxidoreductase [Candidatus Dormibacteraeota bacterium]|nr:oxidoreductase [Candidatus Dormibacteraeota bacterium]
MSAKHRLAMYWAAGCGGCDISVLNLHEALLDVTEHFEPVFWPAVMDAKYRDVEAMPDRSIDVTLFTGGIRTDEDLHLARLLRRKTRVLVAFGSCANEGCVPGLANLRPVEAILEAAFDGPTTEAGEHRRPVARWTDDDEVLDLPVLEPALRTLHQVVDVDYRVPGCPPETERIAEVVGLLVAALDGLVPLPPKGAVLGAGHSTVCDQCRRDRDEKRIARFERYQSLRSVDPTRCLLEQGLPCAGPATRDGCGALCPSAGAPCIGCYGATDGVVEAGARLVSAYASIVDASEPEAIDAILDGLVDPVGRAYRFSLAGSLLRSARPSSASEPARPAGGAVAMGAGALAAGEASR